MEANTSLDTAMKEGANLLKETCMQPYNEALYLMVICLQKKIEWVILNNHLTLDKKYYEYYQLLLQRRLNGEPLAYIRGYQDFWKYEFKVNSSTLIPRPDSETLISAVLKYNTIAKPSILDLGTGSGCLLLTLLSEITGSNGLGIDISKEAIKLATENASSLNLLNRVNFKNISWDELTEESQEKYDIIISNPPYIKKEDLPKLQKELSFEPITALVSGDDGLECYKSILKKLPFICHQNSLIVFEFGQNQDLLPLVSDNYEIIAIEKDLAGISRIIIFKQKKQ